MKKLLFLFTALLLLTSTVFGQRKHKKKKAKENESNLFVSGLLNIDSEEFIIDQSIEEFVEFNGVDTLINVINRSFTIPRNRISIGFSLQNLNTNNTYQEISLTRLTFTKRENLITNTSQSTTIITSGLSNKIWDIQARYAFGKYFLSDNKNKINIGAAIAAEPSFIYSEIDTKVSSLFPLNRYRTRLNLTIIPSALFNITDNFAIGIKVIPNIFHIEWNRERLDNPILTERQRISNDFETTFFNNNVATNIIARFRIQSGEGKKRGKSK